MGSARVGMRANSVPAALSPSWFRARMSWCRASQMGVRASDSGAQSFGSSAQRSRRSSPLLDSTTPLACRPPTLVPFARASTSASPYLPVAQPCCSNQCRQNCVSWSKSSSARKRLMSCSAVRTLIGVPSASSTAAY
ncbi:hypothetical protein FQZ97_718340 [compost metagenome]